MKPTDTIVDEPVTIDGWSPRNSNSNQSRPDHLARGLLAIDQHDQRQDRRNRSASRPSPTWRGGSGSPRRSRPIPSMVLGSSDVRLIEMTRAFASVANNGVAVTPYGIRRVVTADGRMLYQHESDEGRVLVAPWVAAEMTDLLQSAVLSRNRARRADRPACRGQDRNHDVQQGRLVHRLLERADDRRVDGPRRCEAGRRTAGRHSAGARVPRLHDRGRGPASGRAVRDPGADARLAADARGGGLR